MILHAMIGSLSIAETRLLGLLERYGGPFLTAASDLLLDYSERWMREEIREIPNGEYCASDCMEDDGVTDQPVWIRLKLVVRDDEVIADWTGSDPQARGPVNATFVVTAAASYSGLLHLTSNDIPRNSGCYRPIRVVTKPGSVVNVRHPGPSVGGNTETHPHIQNVVVAALSQAIPERAAAAEGASGCNFLFAGVHPDTGEYYTNYHIDGSGWGATAFHDGNSAMCPENGNCRNTPVEVLENKFPWRTLEYRLRPDSGRPRRVSRWTREFPDFAGLGTRDHRECVDGPHQDPCLGTFRRRQGRPRRDLCQEEGDSQFRTFSEAFGTVSDSKFTRVVLKEGDEVMIHSPGGGGYGPSAKRRPEAIERDIRQGWVSLEAAQELYGHDG